MKKRETIYIVGNLYDWDDIDQLRYETIHFSTASSLLLSLNNDKKNSVSCILSDIYLVDTTGPRLLKTLRSLELDIPIIFFCGGNELPICIEAMRAGAINVLNKKTGKYQVLRSVNEACKIYNESSDYRDEKEMYTIKTKSLSKREVQIYKILVAKEGNPTSKDIAKKLYISWRTVQHHRASINAKMEAKSFRELVKMAAYYDV
ncbi:LuxR C-terminal-related transcriptional regulator [Porticoccaceae bacterium]|nr:LuxR C-terminal-related transcriptional regulator [Porticoccaceae bacterium]MDC0134240.1 LuxR C-terminal-related transcriptional regulator [Porticoccaceae bacterium]